MPTLSSLDKARQFQVFQKTITERIRKSADFILGKLEQKRQIDGLDDGKTKRPLIVGINGAQGSGKTTMVNGLVKHLGAHKVSAIGFSLDDLYLTNRDQRELASKHRDNPLLQFRGQPGTHDIQLGRDTLLSLLNNSGETPIPVYDKSLMSGYGDRVPKSAWPTAKAPVDVVLFEGWCIGFRALTEAEFARYIARVRDESSENNASLFKHSRKFSDANLHQINENLKQFETQIYPLLDAWVYMRISDFDIVYRWRKDQEDDLAASGRPSLSDQQLEDFVSRFMPGYEMAAEKLDRQGFLSSGILPTPNTLRMHLDLERNVVAWDHKF
ncbi:hypothetical protein GGI23_005294 [Coemansia sp. RSA 2559]|nr:hypothetical protein GGI23_005294 [Coemansia sp. RSA 2559]KAJ2852907.1 hypothetical protein GGI22_005090 [Coemansia erecta]